jgi:hypothetical protein
MNSASDIVSGFFGVIASAFGIWLAVQIINDRRKLKIAYVTVAVGACLWLPFSWLVLMSGGWDEYRLSWLRMWPILPGLVPGALFFHPNDAIEFSVMGATTLMIVSSLIWLGCRGRISLLAAVTIALMISMPTSHIAYAMYWF